MVAHAAHRCAQLSRANSVQSLPAIAGQQGLGSSQSHAGLPLLRRYSTASSRGVILSARRQTDRLILPVAAASTYENGYGSVGKPDEDVPAVDNSPSSGPSSPAPVKPFYQPAATASAPGAVTRTLKRYHRLDVARYLMHLGRHRTTRCSPSTSFLFSCRGRCPHQGYRRGWRWQQCDQSYDWQRAAGESDR